MGLRVAKGGSPRFGESGFTLVELVVAMTVLAIGIFGTMTVFISSIQATANVDARTTAVAIATREVEGMRAAAYTDIGFSSSQTDYVATVTEGGVVYNTVTVGTPSSAPDGADETHSGITFHVRREILWMTTSYSTHSWKRLVAIVSWTDKVGTHTVRQDSGVYPGGLGSASAPTTTSTTAPPNPSTPVNLTATVNATNPYDHIDLAWSAGAVVPSTWEIAQSADGGSTWVTLSSTVPAGATTYPASGLSANTTYQFRVRGDAANANSSWATASATTQTPPASCTVGAASIAPNPDKKRNANTLQNDLVVTVNTSGSCANLYVYYPVAPSTGYIMTKSGSTYKHTLVKNAYSNWSTGNKTAIIKDASGNVLSSIAFLVN